MPNDHANDHSDTVPMRGDAGDRMLARPSEAAI